MSDQNKSLREQLLELDNRVAPTDFVLKLQQLTNHRINQFQRIAFVCGGLFSLGVGVWFVWLAFTQPDPLPVLARVGLVFGGVVSVATGAIAFQIARSGILKARRHTLIVLKLSSVSAICAGVLLAVLGLEHPNFEESIRIAIAGTLSFLAGGGFMFRQILDEMALSQREQFLKIQYQLCDRLTPHDKSTSSEQLL